MLNFLTANNIMDMVGLDDKLKSMISKQFAIRDKLKPVERRLDTLDKHIRHSENFRAEITLFEAAERYLKDVLQGHFDAKKLPPITKWKVERDKLTADRNKLNQRYISLKDEVKEAEQIRKSVDTIMREETRRTQPKRAHDMEL